MFPDRFGSLQHARTFLDEFVQHYNHEHHHSGIGLHTPADVHYGLAEAATQRRIQTLAAARAATPQRFSSNVDPRKSWSPTSARVVFEPTQVRRIPGEAAAHIGGSTNRGAPCYGEDNEWVLGELLGMSKDEIARVADIGVI